MTDTDAKAAAVLTFWFEELPPEKQFKRDDDVDAMIRERFAELHEDLASGVDPAWEESADRRLAAVIVLDQFSRNLYRDDARAFASDEAALGLAKRGIEAGEHQALPPERALFLVMPLMHSERLADVERSVALLEGMPGNENSAGFARRHRDTIARFGRYPARNAALGREDTAGEAAFLKENPTGF